MLIHHKELVQGDKIAFIPLTQGKVAIVDTEDWEFLMQWRWSFNTRYASHGCPKRILMHRIIAGTPEHLHTDHINGNTLDNRKENLRICAASDNCKNRRQNISHKSSKYKGVSWNKENNKWTAGIYINKKRVHLGYFYKEEDAAKTYNTNALKYFKEYACLNHI